MKDMPWTDELATRGAAVSPLADANAPASIVTPDVMDSALDAIGWKPRPPRGNLEPTGVLELIGKAAAAQELATVIPQGYPLWAIKHGYDMWGEPKRKYPVVGWLVGGWTEAPRAVLAGCTENPNGMDDGWTFGTEARP